MSPYIYRFTRHLIGIDAIPVSLRSWGFAVCLLMTGLALGITYLDFQSFADLDFTQIFLQVIVAAALWKQLRSHRRNMMVPWHTILPSYDWFSKSWKSGQRAKQAHLVQGTQCTGYIYLCQLVYYCYINYYFENFNSDTQGTFWLDQRVRAFPQSSIY